MTREYYKKIKEAENSIELSKDTIFKSIKNIIFFGILMIIFHKYDFVFYTSLIFLSLLSIGVIFNFLNLINKIKTKKVYESIIDDSNKNSKYYREFFENQERERYERRYNKYYNDYREEQKYIKVNTEFENSLKLFDLTENSTIEQFKKKYRELCFKWHPDRYSTDSKENQNIAQRNFQKLTNAYDIIKKHKGFN